MLFSHRLQPGGLGLVGPIALPKGEVLHELVGYGAMPVLLVGRTRNRLASMGLNYQSVARPDECDTCHHMKGLTVKSGRVVYDATASIVIVD